MFVVSRRNSATENFSAIALHETLEGALREAAEIEFAHQDKNPHLFNTLKREFKKPVTEKLFVWWVLGVYDPYYENMEWQFKFANITELDVQP